MIDVHENAKGWVNTVQGSQYFGNDDLSEDTCREHSLLYKFLFYHHPLLIHMLPWEPPSWCRVILLGPQWIGPDLSPMLPWANESSFSENWIRGGGALPVFLEA